MTLEGLELVEPIHTLLWLNAHDIYCASIDGISSKWLKYIDDLYTLQLMTLMKSSTGMARTELRDDLKLGNI